MYISKQWLEQFVDIKKVAPEEIAKRLTLSTVEVEGIKKLGEGLDGIIVGLVERVEKHPNADKLKVCAVNVGQKKNVQIVCGGSNVRVGMNVALAQIGAKVKWHGEGELVELKPVEIRGVPSEGMICGADEIGLLEMFPKKEEKEIVDLTHLAVKPGTALAVALGLHDVVLEIDNKSLSNRPDLWGHYGIAREVAVLFKKTLKPYNTKPIRRGKGTSINVVVNDKKLCSRYMAVAMEGIEVTESPAWMQARLRAAGVRPVNVIVDITNYVMMEIGQPMHAFDTEKIGNKKIMVRRSNDNEVVSALDGKEYTLTKEMLVIADGKKPLAIAGVMGGTDSGVTEQTTGVVFESATFDPVSIRKTSTALGLRSESSARFEKGLSPERAELALKKAVELTLELVPGSYVSSQVIDKKVPVPKQKLISLSLDGIHQKLGWSMPVTEVLRILLQLGCDVTKKKNILSVRVPLWRAKDIAIPEDIIEELARISGYEKITATLPSFSIEPPESQPLRILSRRVREFLAYEYGCAEVYSYSFVSGAQIEQCGLRVEEHLQLENPIAKDRPYIRRTLKTGLLEHVESNVHRFPRVNLFEIGRTYLGETTVDGVPAQPTMLGMVFAEQGNETPFFTVSHAVHSLLERCGMTVTFEQSSNVGPLYHPGRSAYVVVNGDRVGSIGEVHPSIAKRMGIDRRVALSEIALDALIRHGANETRYKPVPAFPEVARDISFIVDVSVQHDALVRSMTSLDPLITSVQLFDVYRGEHTPQGKKSMAYRITYALPDRTLAAADVDTVERRVRDMLTEMYHAEFRASS